MENITQGIGKKLWVLVNMVMNLQVP